MVKDDVVMKLTEQGFDAYLDGSIIMLRVPVRPSKKDMKQIKSILKNMEYKSSWGWKTVKGDTNERDNNRQQADKMVQRNV